MGKRLDFISQLYAESTASFLEEKRKIEAGEPPYIDCFDPEDYDGTPPFLEEWEHAEECIASLGRWSVLLLSSSLKGYLEEFMRDMNSLYGLSSFSGNDKFNYKPVRGKKGWLGTYQDFFLTAYKIDWHRGPALVDALEHLVLNRNDLEHNSDIISKHVYQTASHRSKQSDGIFTDTESRFWDDQAELKVDQVRLDGAIVSVRKFCSWLDGIRNNYRAFIEEAKPDESSVHASVDPYDDDVK